MGFHPKNTVHKMGRPKNIGVHSTGYSLGRNGIVPLRAPKILKIPNKNEQLFKADEEALKNISIEF